MWTQAVWRIEYIVVLALVLIALSALMCKKKLGHYLYVISFSLKFFFNCPDFSICTFQQKG